MTNCSVVNAGHQTQGCVRILLGDRSLILSAVLTRLPDSVLKRNNLQHIFSCPSQAFFIRDFIHFYYHYGFSNHQRLYVEEQHIETQHFVFDVQLNINQSAQRCLFKSPTATEQSRYEVMSAYSYPIGQPQRMIILTKRFHYCGKQAMCEQLVSYSCCLPKANIVIICDYEFY